MRVRSGSGGDCVGSDSEAAVQRIAGVIVSAGLFAGVFLSQASVAQTMSVPGSASVGSSGAAVYTVPISLPPGTAGVTPSLSLEYSSQSPGGGLGAGVVGVGWSLGGLPAIGRCPRTVAQDGVMGAINYDADDRFCLDGQRLMAINGGGYGADGTEYRTEIESFSRIISHGAVGAGPAWFEVRSKSGQVLEFGNTADSRILAQGKATARSWGVNKVSDTKGNYFTVTYINDTTNGQAYPTRIDYTGNTAASLAPFNSVRFIYSAGRPDVVPVYHAGSLLNTTVRLANVQTYAGSTLVADYRLAYQQGVATGRSRLSSVTLCDGSGNCLPATTFTWRDGTLTPTVISNVAGQNGALTGFVPYLGDFNGDGLPDIMWDAELGTLARSFGTRVLWTNSGNGNFTVTGNFAGQDGTLVNYSPIIGDFNRDGRADVWWYQVQGIAHIAAGPTAVWMSTPGTGFSVSAAATAPFGYSSVGIADMNSDNRYDLLWYSGSQLIVWLSNGNGSFAAASSTGAPVASVVGPFAGQTGYYRGLDVNADGHADLLWTSQSAGALALWLGAGDGTFTQVSGADTSIAGYIPYSLDVNGDGNADLLWDQADSYGRSTGQRILWISKGDGTFGVSSNAGGLNGTLAGHVANVGDFNGDGIADVLWIQVDTNGLSTGAQVGWLGKGDGTFTVMPNYGGQDGSLVGYVPVLADFNGDGKTDVLWDSHAAGSSNSTGTRLLWLSDGATPDVITNVTTGVGATATFAYKSLTDSSVYTKDNTAVDPILDAQMALQVVSRLDLSNGVGGTVGTAYTYVGAKISQDGRGFISRRTRRRAAISTAPCCRQRPHLISMMPTTMRRR